MKILVAVDDSKHSEAAVNVVAKYFKPQTTQVKILHVLVPLTLSAIPQMSRGYAPELGQQGTQARALVDKYAQQLRADGYSVDFAVEGGDVRETIIESAERWHADLVGLVPAVTRAWSGFSLAVSPNLSYGTPTVRFWSFVCLQARGSN